MHERELAPQEDTMNVQDSFPHLNRFNSSSAYGGTASLPGAASLGSIRLVFPPK
jgi:hypothetical protein